MGVIVVDRDAIDLREQMVVDFLHLVGRGERLGLSVGGTCRCQRCEEDHSDLNDSLHSTLPIFAKLMALVAVRAEARPLYVVVLNGQPLRASARRFVGYVPTLLPANCARLPAKSANNFCRRRRRPLRLSPLLRLLREAEWRVLPRQVRCPRC